MSEAAACRKVGLRMPRAGCASAGAHMWLSTSVWTRENVFCAAFPPLRNQSALILKQNDANRGIFLDNSAAFWGKRQLWCAVLNEGRDNP
jgi:hypothetical protein